MTRDLIQAPCIGRGESQPLDHQESPDTATLEVNCALAFSGP